MPNRIAGDVQGTQSRTGSSARLALLALVLATFLAASTVPTPLYDLYARQWHLRPSSITIAFGVYAIVLLSSLLIFGRVSDHIGRRPVLLVAIGVQIVGAAILLLADGYGLLLTGRVLQGAATGIGVGAISAAILATDPRRGGVVNAAAPLAGSAMGGLLTGALVQLFPGSRQIAFVILLIFLLAEGVAVWRVVEHGQQRGSALRAVRPTAGLPSVARAGFAAAAPVIFAVYALSGLFASLGPLLVRSLSHSSSALLGVSPLVFMNVAAPITSIVIRDRSAKDALTLGVIGVGFGVIIALGAVLRDSVILLWVGAAVSGVGFGAGFRGGQQLTLAGVSENERAGVVSMIYIVSYLGFGIPAIAAGVIDSASGDLRSTSLEYCAVLLMLALTSGLLLRRATNESGGRDRCP